MLLPEPDAPTSATVSPGATRSEKSRSTGSEARYPYDTPSTTTSPWVTDEVGRVRRLGDDRVGVEDLEDPLRRGPGLRRHRDDLGEHPHRREELHEVGGEGGEGAERDLAVHRQPPAEREHADLAEGRDHLQQRRVLRLEAHVAHPRAVEVACRRR